jgi:hypothetical protein
VKYDPRRRSLVALVDAIKDRIRKHQTMTEQPDLELRHHLDKEATTRLLRIFKMMMQLTQVPNMPDYEKLAELRGFLHGAITKLETPLPEIPNGPVDPNPRSDAGDRPDLQGSANA